jgi:hypothetical protein
VLVLAACGGTSSPATTSTGTGSATPTTESASPSPTRSSVMPSTRTTISFTLAPDVTCDNGVVGVYATTQDPVLQRSVALKDGVASATVSSDITAGMSFDLRCDDWPSTGAVSAVVLQYDNASQGDVPPTDGMGMPTAKRGSWCWAGTTDEQVDITLDAYLDDGDGTPMSGTAAVWALPTLPSIASSDGQRWQTAYSGMLGHQDAPYC